MIAVLKLPQNLPSLFHPWKKMEEIILSSTKIKKKKRKKKKGKKETRFLYILYISRNGIYHLQKVIFAVLIMNVYFIHTSSKLSSYTIRTGGILFHTFRCLKAVWKCISHFLIWEHFNRRGFNLFWNFNSCSAQKLKLESIKMHFSADSILIFLFSVSVQFT